MNNCVIVRDYRAADQEFWTGSRWSMEYPEALPVAAKEGVWLLRRKGDYEIPRDGCTVHVVHHYGYDDEAVVYEEV